MLKANFTLFLAVLFGTAHATSAPEKAVALIAGKPISDKDLEQRAAPRLRELNSKIFEVKQKTLNDMIDEQLLNLEAGRVKLSVQQLLVREVDSRVVAPTPAEVDSYYLGIKDRIGLPLEEVRPKILDFLTETRRRSAYDDFLSRLRSREKVVVLLEPPRAVVAIDPARIRGPANAPITIVEFSDFECPYCGRVEDTVRQLTSRFPTQIKLAYRDFPSDFHSRAEAAAEASRCALAQGKYWPYHDLLFDNQQHLQSSDLSNYALQVGMDPKRFDECVMHKTYAADIQHDLDAGQELGITGTPAFFINGILLSGAVPLEEFVGSIERELLRLKSAN
jgi:protein-disulfide isomerase